MIEILQRTSIMYLMLLYCLLPRRAACAFGSFHLCIHKQKSQEAVKWVSLDQVRTISSRSLFSSRFNNSLRNYCLTHQLNVIGLRNLQLNKFYGRSKRRLKRRKTLHRNLLSVIRVISSKHIFQLASLNAIS